MLHKYILPTIAVTLVSTSSLQALTLKKSVEEAILTNYEISSNNLKTKSDKVDIEIEEGNYRPTIDFNSNIESSDVKNKRDGQPSSGYTDNTDGYNLKLTLEQLLYDGGKTPSLIREKQSNYKSSFHNTTFSNNKIIFDVVKNYNNILKIEAINKINSLNKIAHDEALEIAYNKEEISGEILETKKTQAMIYALNDKIYTQEVDLNAAYSEFKKITGLEARELCKIQIDETKLPQDMSVLVSLAYENNAQIKEQQEKVKVQQEKLTQVDAKYLPTIKARLEASHDNDIELTNSGVQDKILGEISLNWNFYSGGKDDLTTDKNVLLLNKEKKALEKIKLDTKEEVTNLYKEYQNIKKKITNHKLALSANEEILNITTQQLEDGTKTFIDLLLAKSKVYETQIDILTQEHSLQEKYFEILHNITSLSEFILDTKEVECNQIAKEPIKEEKTEVVQETNESDAIEALLEEPVEIVPEVAPIVTPKEDTNETNATKNIEAPKPIESEHDEVKVAPQVVEPVKTFEDEVKEVYANNNHVIFDDELFKATINITSNSFTIKKVNERDSFKNVLDNIAKPLLEVISKHKSNIKNVIINSHTSSEHRRFTKRSDMDKANLGLSQRRANKVKDYFIAYAQKNGLDTNMVKELFIAKGKGSQNLILDHKGSEDSVASRRVVIEIDKK
jgi:adhesin transport system outer membrane protein